MSCTSKNAALDTLPKLLRRNSERYSHKGVAVKVKVRGIWRGYTWRECYEKTKYFSLGLISLDLQPKDKVSIIGENKPEWFWAELAVQSAGGIVVGIFTDCTPPEVQYYINHSDSTFVVAHDQEQVDKLLQIRDECPQLKKVIYWDSKGLWNYADSILLSFEKVIDLGSEYEKTNPHLFEENIEKGQGEDVAIICYTSGTTGLPKGAMISHRGLLAYGKSIWVVDRLRDSDQYVSFLPPAWIGEQGNTCSSLVSGMTIAFPEKPETVQENIREIGPQVIGYSPRLWETVMSAIQAKISDTSTFRRFLYHLFIPVGYKVADLKMAKKKVGLLWRILYLLATWAVFHSLRDRIGLSMIRCAYTGGAPISPEILRYFQAIGVNIKQLYGGSEQGLVSLHADGDIKPETSGRILPDLEVRLSDEGEIMTRGAGLFLGYYKDPEVTKTKFKEGFYCTGDFGSIDEDNHLIVIDRMEDLKTLRNGRKFSPQYAEVRLRFCPYIKDALVIGSEERDFVTAIMNIDLDNVGRWAETRRISYTTYTDLSQKPQVVELIKGYVQNINRTLPEWAQIKKFVNLHREFDADEGELTRTRKLRRTLVVDRYADLINALYSNKTEYPIESEITYRDGRKGSMLTVIQIITV